MRRRSGFTLIEVLIAFTIMVLVLVELGRVQSIAGKLLERSRRPALVSSDDRGNPYLTEDCRNFVSPGFLGPKDPVIDLTNVDAAGGSKGKLTFFTAQYDPVTAPCLGKVSYAIADEGLVRAFVPLVGDEQEVAALTRTTVLLPRAKGLEVFLNDGTEFVKDYSGRLGLPYGVKLRITVPVGDEDGGKSIAYEWYAAFKGGRIPIDVQSRGTP